MKIKTQNNILLLFFISLTFYFSIINFISFISKDTVNGIVSSFETEKYTYYRNGNKRVSTNYIVGYTYTIDKKEYYDKQYVLDKYIKNEIIKIQYKRNTPENSMIYDKNPIRAIIRWILIYILLISQFFIFKFALKISNNRKAIEKHISRH